VPVNYRIDGNVVTIHPAGTYSAADLRSAWLAAEAEPVYPTPITKLRICVDVRDTESLARKSVAELRESSDWFAQRAYASSRICAFVTRTGFQYGLARMMAAWIEYKGYRTFVTTEPHEAVQWLKNQPSE
jgi:hypothetical protein